MTYQSILTLNFMTGVGTTTTPDQDRPSWEISGRILLRRQYYIPIGYSHKMERLSQE